MIASPFHNSTLSRAAGVNEDIKRIIAIAFRINLMALNAILLARRAGAVARGFGVLSNELREFIRALEGSMLELRVTTARTVTAVSDDACQRRTHGMIDRTDQQLRLRGIERSAQVQSVIDRQERGAEERRQDIALLHKALMASLVEVERLVEFGAVLARTAKIEGAYGGEFAASLSLVALQFGQTIEDIMLCVKSLRERSGGAE